MASPEMIIKISGNSAAFQKELTRMERRIAIGNAKISKEEKKKLTDDLRRQDLREKYLIKSYKRIAVAAAAVAVGVGVAVTAFAKYETAVVAMQRTTGLAGKELEDFKKEISDISTRMKTGEIGLLGIAQAAGQLGITGAKNLAKFTETMAKFDIASASLRGEAAATSFARIIGLTEGDISLIENYGSELAHLGDVMKANEAQIAHTAEELAKTNPVFKLSTTNTIAMAAAFTDVGVKAELTRTSILMFSQKLGEALRAGGDELDTFMALTGMTAEEIKKNLQDSPEKVFVAFSKGLKQTGQDGAMVLKSIGLASRQLTPTLLAAAQGVDVFEKAIEEGNQAFKDNKKLNTEMQMSLDTTAASYSGLKDAAMDALRAIGEVFAPAARIVMDGLAALLRDMVKSFSSIDVLIDSFYKKAVEYRGIFREKVGLPPIPEAPKSAAELTQKSAADIEKEFGYKLGEDLLTEHLKNKQKIQEEHNNEDDELSASRAVAIADAVATQKQLEQDKLAEEREAKLEREQAEYDEDTAQLTERLEQTALLKDKAAAFSVAKERTAHLEKTKAGKKQLAIEKAEVDEKIMLAQFEFAGKIGAMGQYVKEGTALSKALFLVQKAAAVASAIVSAHSASALALANPPGPPTTIPMSKMALALGYADAAAIGASAISGMAEGGRVPGGFGGGDRVPAMLEAGELVVPKMEAANFEQVIRDDREGVSSGVHVEIGLDEDASKVLTVKQREDSVLGIQS